MLDFPIDAILESEKLHLFKAGAHYISQGIKLELKQLIWLMINLLVDWQNIRRYFDNTLIIIFQEKHQAFAVCIGSLCTASVNIFGIFWLLVLENYN